MEQLFLLSKAGKVIISITDNDDNLQSYIVALQALNVQMEQSYNKKALTMKMGDLTLVYKDMEQADLFLIVNIIPKFASKYADMVENIILSTYSSNFLNQLKNDPSLDLQDQFQPKVQFIKSILAKFTQYPYFVALHKQKIVNRFSIDQLLTKQQLLAVVYDEDNIIQVFKNLKIKLNQFGEQPQQTSMEMLTFYLFLLVGAENISIMSISKTTQFQIQKVRQNDNYWIAYLTLQNSQEIPKPFPNIDVQPIIKIQLPKRIQGIAIINKSQNRGIFIGNIAVKQLEIVLDASEEGGAIVLENPTGCITAWCLGDYVICIVSTQTELQLGQKLQDDILSTVYEYFAYKTW